MSKCKNFIYVPCFFESRSDLHPCQGDKCDVLHEEFHCGFPSVPGSYARYYAESLGWTFHVKLGLANFPLLSQCPKCTPKRKIKKIKFEK